MNYQMVMVVCNVISVNWTVQLFLGSKDSN